MTDYDFRKLDVGRLLPALGIQAKRSGYVWEARCPSHGEKTASWTIIDRPGHDDHGLHHCFGCGFQGTALDLAVHVLEVSRPVAREWVVEKAIGAAPPPLFARVRLQGAATGFRMPVGFDDRPIAEWPPSVRAYAERRGITTEQAAAWRLGFAIAGKLHGRIVIPVRDQGGRLANYTARTFADADVKYLGASRDERPNLDVVLGEEWWPPREERDTLVTVEGGINAMAVARVTTTPVGAILGSEVRPGHVLRLSTFPRIVVLTDPDAAGDKAAAKIAALGRHVQVERLRTPAGEDAQSLGPERLRRLLDAVGA